MKELIRCEGGRGRGYNIKFSLGYFLKIYL
jgi:hypothetical protein